eukprot:m.53143 g.53143  ORF g.53143 m.53143 type:complete len:395 (-) comp15435_c0_seq12:582-1766(-)
MPKKSSKLAEQRRHGPVDQNLHDPRALGAGRGVYFRFQVKWMGCVEMKDSIRKFSLEDQTEIGRKAVQLAVQRKQEQRVAKLSKGATYNFGRVTSAGVDVALSVSSQGLLVTPLDYVGGDDDEVGIISFIPMRLVTLTVGGEDEVYDCITYIGKDAETQVREAFVFDCGEDVDYVLSTIAQAFFLAMAEAKEARIRAEQKPRRASASSPPKAISSTADDDTEAAEAPAPTLSLDYKTGTIVKKADEKFSLPKEIERLLLEAGDIPEEAELPMAAVDVTKNEKGEMDDISTELVSLMKTEVKCMTLNRKSKKTATIAEPLPEAETAKASMSRLIQAFNAGTCKKGDTWTSPKLKQAGKKDMGRPTWVYFQPAQMGASNQKKSMKAIRDRFERVQD